MVGGATNGTTSSVTLTDDTALGKVGINSPSAVPIITDATQTSTTHNNQLIYAKAIKAYVDTVSSSAQIFQGGYDALNNVPSLDDAGNPPTGVQKGWTYIVTSGGTFFSANVYIGDHIIANQNFPTTLNHWTIVGNNLQSASTEVPGIIEIATNDEVVTGTAANLAVTPASLKGVLGTSQTLSLPRKYSSTITGAANQASFTFTHGLNSRDVVVSIRESASPFSEVEAEVFIDTVNTVVVNFSTPPAAGKYQLTIIG